MPPSSSLTPLGVAALALLVERPMHPYEMYQTLVQRSEERVVKVRPGSLYHTVDRLAASGLVRATGTEREGNRPERTTYEITERGSLALSERVAEILGTPVNEYPEFPLALGEAHNLPVESV
ncbi:MAG TPA: PadR family transcriptional regulator, partial [Leifsonia sp.]